MDAATKPLGQITQSALEGNILAVVLLLAIVAVVVTVLGAYWVWDKHKFHRSKKKDGVPVHVVQTESTTQLAIAVRSLTDGLMGIRVVLDKQGLAIADLATATQGLNHLQESWGAQMMEREDRAHDLRQAIRMGQRDLDDSMKELNRRVGKLACSKANGAELAQEK